MAKTLGGVVFCIDAIKYDYCIEASIQCLQELCDQVVVLDAGSNDGTMELLEKYNSPKTMIVSLDREEWEKQRGKEKLAYFQNLALSMLNTDYYYLQQADEVTHEDYFSAIREAIETNEEAFLVERVNLWGDCNHYINVHPRFQPCSKYVVRLAKTKYLSVGDGESIGCPIISDDWLNGIRMVHYGFVRKKEVMKSKVINMQENVFELGLHDPRLDGAEVFISERWFKGNELSPIGFEHPKYIKEWIKNRP